MKTLQNVCQACKWRCGAKAKIGDEMLGMRTNIYTWLPCGSIFVVQSNSGAELCRRYCSVLPGDIPEEEDSVVSPTAG